MTITKIPRKIPRKLMDDFDRCQIETDKAVKKIGEAFLKFTMDEGMRF